MLIQPLTLGYLSNPNPVLVCSLLGFALPAVYPPLTCLLWALLYSFSSDPEWWILWAEKVNNPSSHIISNSEAGCDVYTEALCLANDFEAAVAAAEISIGEGSRRGLLIVPALKDEIEQEWSAFGALIFSPQLWAQECVCMCVGWVGEIDKEHDSRIPLTHTGKMWMWIRCPWCVNGTLFFIFWRQKRKE